MVVTANLKDFPADMLPEHAIKVVTPASFLTELIQQYPQQQVPIVREQAAAMRRPPMTFGALIDKVAAYAPTFVSILRQLDAREGMESDG